MKRAALLAAAALVCCASLPHAAQAQHTVITLESQPDGRPVLLDLSPQADSALTTLVDQATGEWAWCLHARVDSVARIVLVDSVTQPTYKESFTDSVHFACSHGTAPAHLHLLDHGHEDGPTSRDLVALWRTLPRHGDTLTFVRNYPFGLVVVRQRDPRYVKFYVYGLGGGIAP